MAALTTGPAAILGLPKPGLREGEAADCVLVAAEDTFLVEPSSLRSKSRNSPLLGRTLPARIDLTLARGAVAFDRADLRAAPPPRQSRPLPMEQR